MDKGERGKKANVIQRTNHCVSSESCRRLISIVCVSVQLYISFSHLQKQFKPRTYCTKDSEPNKSHNF